MGRLTDFSKQTYHAQQTWDNPLIRPAAGSKESQPGSVSRPTLEAAAANRKFDPRLEPIIGHAPSPDPQDLQAPGDALK
jgi:hypothetical protein